MTRQNLRPVMNLQPVRSENMLLVTPDQVYLMTKYNLDFIRKVIQAYGNPPNQYYSAHKAEGKTYTKLIIRRK